MTWNPPASELPLRDYVLTWWKSSLDGVSLFDFKILFYANNVIFTFQKISFKFLC
jgi:hypothetical protein